MIARFVKVAVLAAGVILTGCASEHARRLAPDEAPVVMGSRVRANTTPLESAFGCLARGIEARRQPQLAIAVGDVKDYTGRYSQQEGSTITQGGPLMVYTALGKLGPAIRVAERFDTRIAELELAYIDRRQLGDGDDHVLDSGKGKSQVPWVPYFGGSILRSDYYIIGGITELNYNIQSGGFEFAINNSGIKNRTYTMNIGVDLRIVDTKSLRVVKTVSLEKQITGYEVGADTFRFFGNRLFDVNVGAKNQEPLQLGVRTVLEQGTLELVGAVAGSPVNACIQNAEASRETASGTSSPMPSTGQDCPITPGPAETCVANHASMGPKPLGRTAVNAAEAQSGIPQNGGAAIQAGTLYQVPFDFGSTALGAPAVAAIEKIVGEAAQGSAVNIQVTAHDSENWAPQKRQDMTNARIGAITDALVQRGVPNSRIRTTWVPSLSDTGITHDGAGYQIFAKLEITQP
ncbi:CsgG/HfaB family protein [Rhodanobacter sp. Col0626]|uniref:CsgG/HfaB family protein n=1 Tax=Rhodanobacter sp. Col0626 TaxID=3415679 RepID=UPI003CF63F05